MDFLLKSFTFICLINIIWSSEDHDHHNHETVSRNNIFEELFEHLNTTSKDAEGHTLITVSDLEKLFQDLNFRKCNSSEVSNDCNLCFAANDFFKWNKLSGRNNVSEEEFEDLSTGLLYLLTPFSTSTVVCKSFIQNITTTTTKRNFYNQIQNVYGNPINEESLEKILEDVNKTIGEKLTGKECFSVHDVIKTANVSETNITEADFKYVAGFIILKLADGNCIKKEEHKTSPKPSFFIGEIYEKFGAANGGGITHEKFEELYKNLKLGSTATTQTDSHEGHNHRRRKRRAADGHDDEEKFKKCYTAENILGIYSVKEGDVIGKTKFQEMCPSLVQQIESGVCVKPAATTSNKVDEDSDDWRPWIASIISIFIISLGSLSGVVTIPISKKKWFPYLLITMMSLAISVMIGDAVLHLLPHALDLHGHSDGEAHAHEDGNPQLKKDSYIWKCLLVLLGIYMFFIFEMTMHAFGGGHTHGHSKPATEVIQNSHAKGTVQMNEEGSVICVGVNGLHDCQELSTIPNHDSLPKKYDYTEVKPQKQGLRGFQSIVWMILIGDGIHNFLDGVAVGVAFSETWPDGYLGGISTSLAVFAHEVPHELGDFAVLLNSGLSIKQALVMNFLSSLMSFIGGFIGVALGTEWEASPWIFSITAGMFIYIALVDMLPEVLHSHALKENTSLTMILANIGLITGFVLMFVLGAWEEDIKTALK